jgi:hypothetical protein
VEPIRFTEPFALVADPTETFSITTEEWIVQLGGSAAITSLIPYTSWDSSDGR